MAKLKSKSTHPWQQSLLDRYGPLKEIWLASYAPFYAFIVFRHRTDAQVKYSQQLFHLNKVFRTNDVPFHRNMILRHVCTQDAASGADGETIAGRRIRVSHARPRTVGPRDRFIPDKYTRDRGELVPFDGLRFLCFGSLL